MTPPRRSALIIANDSYTDERLRKLRAPAIDAAQLARVLGDDEIGGFEVDVSINEPEHLARRKLATFFDDRGLDDILLLHLSCHGVKDEDGRLYFATPDTVVDQLDATSLSADFVNRQMTRSRSRRIVLLLDCCYSGAFARGMISRGEKRMDLVERFDGRGRIVLTASSAMEYSFEGDQLTGEGNPSVFTSALVEGLATGEADRDRDGYVSVDELYDYAYERVRSATPSQTPGKWVFDVQGDFYIARSKRPPEPVVPSAGLRGSAGETPTATSAPTGHETTVAATVAVTPVAPESTSAPPGAGPEPAPPTWVPVVGTLSGVGLIAALPLPLLAEDLDRWNAFAVLAPFEVALAALALFIGSRAVRRHRLSTSAAAGLFLVVGIMLTSAGLGAVKFAAQRAGLIGVALALVAATGAVTAIVAGVACWRALSGRTDRVRVEPAWLGLGLVAALLAGVALFLPYDGSSSLWSEIAEVQSAEFVLEPAAAVICLGTGTLLLSSRRGVGIAMLITAGALTAIHYLGVLLAAAFAIGEVGEVGPAGVVGLVGGLLGVVAGCQVRQSSSE